MCCGASGRVRYCACGLVPHFLSKKKKRSGGAISCIPQPVYAFMGAILIECDVSCLHCIRGAVVLLLHGEAL